MARQANANERPVALHPGSCALHLCALAIASGSLCFRKGTGLFSAMPKVPAATSGFIRRPTPRGIAIGDGAHHWTLCHDAALLHAGLGGRSNSPWPNDSLLAPDPHCKHARHPREEEHPLAKGDSERPVFNPSFSNRCAMRS
jgi:hypothetical protein